MYPLSDFICYEKFLPSRFLLTERVSGLLLLVSFLAIDYVILGSFLVVDVPDMALQVSIRLKERALDVLDLLL